MKYKILGRTGVRISELCLGAMTFGEDWGSGIGASKEESRKMFDAFLKAGGNFIDTANLYTHGTSESFLGDFMQGQRERIVLATKYTNSFPTGDPNSSGNHRKNLVQSLDASLKRLKTDYIDLYWVHAWDFMSSTEEVMRALDAAVRSGKVLYVGISDAPAWVVAKANTIAELRGWAPFVGLQIEYSLAERTCERELLPMAKDFDLTVAAWGPLNGGTLTGKYLQSNVETDARYTADLVKSMHRPSERKDNIVREVLRIAKEVGCTPSQVAISWLRQTSSNIVPILGAKRLSQLEDNLASLDVKLSETHMNSLQAVSSIEMGFPHDFFDNDMARMVIYAGMRDLIEV
ncbi:MAG: aldo/keto reductase [Candidatus Obscuribacter sp.]|nr:aldo/keto reductase [Candidatus Obscuribacter sp.]